MERAKKKNTDNTIKMTIFSNNMLKMTAFSEITWCSSEVHKAVQVMDETKLLEYWAFMIRQIAQDRVSKGESEEG